MCTEVVLLDLVNLSTEVEFLDLVNLSTEVVFLDLVHLQTERKFFDPVQPACLTLLLVHKQLVMEYSAMNRLHLLPQ